MKFVDLARIVKQVEITGIDKQKEMTEYDRPGVISNKVLYQDTYNKILKRNLIENIDYVSVPSKIWR